MINKITAKTRPLILEIISKILGFKYATSQHNKNTIDSVIGFMVLSLILFFATLQTIPSIPSFEPK